MPCNKNLVIKTLEKELTKVDLMQGEFLNPGTREISLSFRVGSVYGIFVQLNDEEIEQFKKDLIKYGGFYKNRLLNWKPIKDNFYPLYWGSDQYIGSRLLAHSKSPVSTGTLHLNNRKELIDKKIIYGAILCDDYKESEKRMRKLYPDVYKTKSRKKNNNLGDD